MRNSYVAVDRDVTQPARPSSKDTRQMGRRFEQILFVEQGENE